MPSASMRALSSSGEAIVGPAAAPKGTGRQTSVIEDGAAQAALQPWIGMECYQLSVGSWLAQMDSLDLGRLQVVRERQYATVQKLGTTPADCCTISYCTPDPAFRFTEQAAAGADQVFFMPGNRPFDLFIPQGAQTGYVSFSAAEFISGARVLNPKMWERPPRDVALFRAAQPHALPLVLDLWLASAATAARSGVVLDTDMMGDMILQTALQLVTHEEQDDTPPPPAARARAVRICRLARDYLHSRFEAHLMPTIVEVCRAVGVSERSLQYAFQTCVGMSPLRYIRRCRLNRVRSTLLASDGAGTTVTRIAMQFGFLHLGRFAGEYKQTFQEAPTATLARSV